MQAIEDCTDEILNAVLEEISLSKYEFTVIRGNVRRILLARHNYGDTPSGKFASDARTLSVRE